MTSVVLSFGRRDEPAARLLFFRLCCLRRGVLAALLLRWLGRSRFEAIVEAARRARSSKAAPKEQVFVDRRARRLESIAEASDEDDAEPARSVQPRR